MPGSQSSRVSSFKIGGCKAIKNTAVGVPEEVCSVPRYLERVKLPSF